MGQGRKFHALPARIRLGRTTAKANTVTRVAHTARAGSAEAGLACNA